MNAVVIGNRRFPIDWGQACKWTKELGKLAFAFALGGWVVSIRAQEATIPYKDRSTVQLEQIHKAVGANPVQQIQCDRKVAAAVAEVVKSKAADDTAVSELPVQVCPPPTPLPASPSAPK